MTGIKPIHLSPLKETPLVSIVITSYNYAEFICEALNSVVFQGYNNLEIIVADDGSKDETQQIVRRYIKIDPRVSLVTGENVGQPGNTNRGYAASTGEIVCFLDADDRFRRGKVEAVVQAFRAFPDHGLVLHPLQRIDQSGRAFGQSFPKFIDSGWLLDRLLKNAGRCSFPATSAISIRREIAQAVFPIQSASRRVGDAYIHYPAAFLTKVCKVPEILAEYRCHERSMTRASKSQVDQLSAFLREYEEVFSTNQQFVNRQFGNQIAAKLKLTDSQDYLENVLRYLTYSELNDYIGLSARDCVAMIRDSSQKAKWKVLMCLPRLVTQQAFAFRRNFLKAIRYVQVKLTRPAPSADLRASCFTGKTPQI
jgi:glycosyltransferase involved in cell wall biosynthesis